MRTTRTLMLSILAVFAFSAVAAGAAQASGPVWIIPCYKTAAKTGEFETKAKCENPAEKPSGTKNLEYERILLAGQTRKIKSENIAGAAGVFELTGPVNVLCKKEKDTGELIGGNPGTDKSTVTFSECALEKKTVAECSATGTGQAKESGIIVTKVKTVLVFPEGSRTEALDAFFSEEANNVFAEFILEGPKCGLLNKVTVKVEANGTEIELPTFKEKRKCGVLAEVGKIVAGAFVKTKSGEVATEGGLRFPTPERTKAEVEKGTTFEKITCGLHVKTSAGASAAGDEEGVSKVETEPAEGFGWEE